MDLIKPRPFETTDRAHADIFNEVIERLNENDEQIAKRADEAEQNAQTYLDKHAGNKNNPHGVTKDQIGLDNVDNIKQAAKTEFDSHVQDVIRHITDIERNKWNGAQLFKITSDSGIHKINLTSGSFFSALKDVGTVTFYGTNAVEDTPTNGSLRGMQLVGQKGIGMGYAVDTLGNAWWFYYNTVHTAINWFPIESKSSSQTKADTALSDAKKYTDNLKADLTKTTWLYPVLQNDWVNYTDANKVRYMKDTTGTVFVEGAIAKGKVGFEIPAFELPVGYRPSRSFQFVGVASQIGMSGAPQHHRLLVDINGRVIIENCSNTVNPNEFISLGFSFKAG
ncbi:hypothetical protein [Bacillus swezeyi]|uniref:Uncharacterized protein n=1 Tax=Bacillus swezeyi TaxID=1925020 RepID=A0A5M8RX19_9BACI|nr:hypothetical protein [Bacillus swezeyi]KAA6453197.1 hypothetical protein DX927_03035 [Bacillus swezeyi]KAA6476185.1 hypothetical protein DX928_08885 [Bacillus swezeyi]TYS38567.1 hypothetical protein FZC77_02925 [Bacillus swezeyi]